MGDHMILQQNSSVKLWGWADNKKVTVTTSWNNQTYQVLTDKNGAWLVKVDTPGASYTPYSITISDGEDVILSDILIGEVWICSGQSNMDMRMMGNTGQPIDRSLETILHAGNYRNRIRFIAVSRTKDAQQRIDFEGRKWEVSAPEAVMTCSAVAYFFAKQVTEVLDIPVGLVISSWGGSRIESWMNEKTLASIDGVDIEAARSSKLKMHHRLGCMYDTMLWPVRNFTARGFLWYQGESNIFNYYCYAPMMTAMVQLWREVWEAPNMPFYYVQIAPHKYKDSQDTDAALLREAQTKALEAIPNSGMVSTIDIGDEFCIHPPQKDIVGLRLATLALTKTYNICGLPSTGPTMTKVNYSEGKAIVTFDNASAGLTPAFCNLKGFEIAVKESAPVAIMTSYNRVNGVHAANSRALCTVIAREEWGFDGVLMSDWSTTAPEDGSIPWKCIEAGNDLIMPGSEKDDADIRQAYADGRLSEKEIRLCAGRIISLINKLDKKTKK